MKKLVLQMQISVDGFVSGPNGEMEWIFKNFDDDATAWIVDTLWQAGMHIMGRRTFHDMKAYWPRSTEPYAPPMNEIPKVVFCKNGLAAPEKVELTTAFEDASRVRAAEDGHHTRKRGELGRGRGGQRRSLPRDRAPQATAW